MIHAYQEIYLRHAQAALGDAFDYAVNTCGISGTDFTKLFTVSTISRRMENGEPKYLSGKSGIEIVHDVVLETMGKELSTPPKETMWRSCEYWIGWAVAYYQWYSARKYIDIFKALPFKELQRMYPTLHEANITKFVEVADQRLKDCFPETSLKRIRSAYGCSQSELAQLSGVSLRSIQMYGQRNKDINKASVETVVLLSQLRQKPDDYIDVDVDVAELTGTSAETKATYDKIKKYVAEHNDGMKVSSLNIAQVKAKYGIIERDNFNKPRSEGSKQPQCPQEKEEAIVNVLKMFQMI